MCVYVPIALFFASVIISGRKVFGLSSPGTTKKCLNRPQRRRKTLIERKRLKMERRKYAKMLRIWREYKRGIRNKYGWLPTLLCEPLFLQFVLCVHWVVTWWISVALRGNVTKMLEENYLRSIRKEWETDISNLNQSRPSVAHGMRLTGYRRKEHSSLDYSTIC